MARSSSVSGIGSIVFCSETFRELRDGPSRPDEDGGAKGEGRGWAVFAHKQGFWDGVKKQGRLRLFQNFPI